jgi:glycosyltransferase involved in cell wall biosynthesis
MFVINTVAADARVIKEASTLVEAGHEVTVVAMHDGRQPRRDTLEGFAVLRVRRDPVARDIGGRARRPSRVAQALEPLVFAIALLDYYARAFVLALRLRAHVYHAHDLVTLPVAWAAGRCRGAKVVYDAHELFTEIGRLGRVPRAVFRVMETLLIGRADAVMTVNDSIAAELARRYSVPRPVVLRNCPRTPGHLPDRTQSPLRERAAVPAGVPLVLYQGMFMAHRGLDMLIRATSRLARAHVVFMGWGPLLQDLRALAVVEGVQDRVHFLEGVPLAELLEVTAGADVGVIPYRNVGLNNYYTSPNKLFEYCAAGVPIACSHFPELVQVVERLGLGRTFDPESPASIAQAVDALVEDPPALAKARAAVASAAAEFTWEREKLKLLAVYEGLKVTA